MIAYIVITSWRGISIGGEHYYASVELEDDSIASYKITHTLSEREAAYLNKKDQPASWHKFVAGEDSERFESREEAIECAREFCLNSFSNLKLVLAGDSCYVSPTTPYEVVWAKDPAVGRMLRNIYIAFEKARKDNNEKAEDRLYYLWEDTLLRHGIIKGD